MPGPKLRMRHPLRSPPAPRGCIAAAARATTRWRWSCSRAATRSRCSRSTRRRIPTRPTSAATRVLFGGISIYLQQYVSLFRKTPRFLDRLWDAPWVIDAFASRSLSTDPRHARRADDLDARRGSRRPAEGVRQAARVDRATSRCPTSINLPNSLLIGAGAAVAGGARPAGLLHAAGRGPVPRRPRSSRIAAGASI